MRNKFIFEMIFLSVVGASSIGLLKYAILSGNVIAGYISGMFLFSVILDLSDTIEKLNRGEENEE